MSSSGNRLETDIMKLMMDYKVELINDGMKDFYVDFHGAKDSLYEGGLWKVKVLLPDDYPASLQPFVLTIRYIILMLMKTLVWFCLDVISQTWSPMFGLVNVFEVFLPQLLLFPNPPDPFNQEAASLMMRDLSVYEQTVKEYCEKYAKPEDEAVSSDEKSTEKEPSEAESHSSDETVVAKPYL